MNKLVLLIAAICLLPVVLFAYFVLRPVLWPADAGQGLQPAAASVVEGTRLVIPAPEVPPPEVPGPVLRPHLVDGEVVTERLVPEKKPPERTYTVQPGDTLFDIAVSHFGDSSYVQDILRKNPDLVPSLIRVGQEIILPPKRSATAAAEGNAEKPGPPEKKPQIYIVRRGDTLIGIARRLYGDAAMHEQIFQLNRDKLPSKDRLREGLRLTLPPPPSYD